MVASDAKSKPYCPSRNLRISDKTMNLSLLNSSTHQQEKNHIWPFIKLVRETINILPGFTNFEVSFAGDPHISLMEYVFDVAGIECMFKFDADVPYFTYPLLEFCCTQVTETPDEAAGNNAKWPCSGGDANDADGRNITTLIEKSNDKHVIECMLILIYIYILHTLVIIL